MLKFNFDSEFFRRVISRSPATERVPSLTELLNEAIDLFYDEFDYYPETGVYAPGVFTIFGDHMEYVEGKLVQAALPYGTVIVGKAMNTVKCKIVTTSNNVDGLKKSVFPLTYVKRQKPTSSYPNWVTYLQGTLSYFSSEELKGFDALIHSSVPPEKGCGSSAALQVAFYTFLEATCGNESRSNKEIKGQLCQKADSESKLNPFKMGSWSNLTSSVAEKSSGVFINCRNGEALTFDMKEIEILFLLIYPNFQIELNDRDCLPRREMELYLIARLLGLEHIKQATEQHLKILENMEDPSRDTVIEILRSLGRDEDDIFDFVDELFYFPKSVMDLEFIGEAEEGIYELGSEKGESFNSEMTSRPEVDQPTGKVFTTPCLPKTTLTDWKKYEVIQKKSSYMHKRIAELCEGKIVVEKVLEKQEVCEKINCLGGLENFSEASDMTVVGRLLRRLRHIITEKMRCDSLPDLVLKGDYTEFGTLLIRSHLSLKLDYQISCATLDNLVQLAIDTDDVYGAKMMSGGGTLTLLHRCAVEKFIEKVKESFGEDFRFHLVFPNAGARILDIGVKKNPKSILSNDYLNKTDLMKKAVQNFEATYQYRPTHGAYSPGVLTLLGDYVDYNHGFNISLASSLLTVVVGAFNGTSKVRVVTTNDTEGESNKIIFPLPISDDLTPGRVKWAKLIRGVVCHFEGTLRGFDCLIESNISAGSGMPSPTVLIMAFYTFLEVLNDQKTEDLCKKAHTCMAVQQDFANITCGMGDSTISVRARKDFAILLDCRLLSSVFLPFQDTSVSLVMSFTNQNSVDLRCLLYSRMEDCYKVARALGGKTLRCLTLKQLDELKSNKVSETALRRAKHVVLENERVLRSAEALKNNDFESLGELMVASHNSLRYNFEVTTPELDFLVERAMEVDGVLGSKMVCNGNSSCTVTLVKRWAVDDLIEYMQSSFGEKLNCYVITPYDGCGPLNVKEYVDSIPGPQFVFEDIFTF